MSKKRGELVWDTFIPWVIGLVVLILMLVIYLLISKRTGGGIDYFKNLLRMG